MGVCSCSRQIENLQNVIEDSLIKDLFDQCDENKSGSIEKNELTILIDKLAKGMGVKKPSQQEIDEAMSVIDINQDGQITFKEYKRFVETALKEHEKK